MNGAADFSLLFKKNKNKEAKNIYFLPTSLIILYWIYVYILSSWRLYPFVFCLPYATVMKSDPLSNVVKIDRPTYQQE